MPNRLAHESSPYLLQHQDNPVDWWPWCPEAFAEAQRRDVPVFISIGYAACHWCHVMAHESFEDAATALVMNAHFINIKIDREERPEVDAVYMNAIHLQGDGGGWPLSAFCTSDGRPFFMGTYFPPRDRYGRPGFATLLRLISDAWATRREELVGHAATLLAGLRDLDLHARRFGHRGDVTRLRQDLVVAAGRAIAVRTDPKNGGLGDAPKFPSSPVHGLLGRAGRLRGGEQAREAYLAWARAMAKGGLYDHLGGGFARYSVDAAWRVPHFEKMLYDNAQLLGIYADAIALGASDLAWVVPQTVAFLERELCDPSGALWSSLDADSEGAEGRFYVWTPAEVAAVLGDDAVRFCEAYGVTKQGNFEHGTSVLARVGSVGSAEEEAALAALRRRLLAARGERVRPGTDDKVLAAWNGLAISGLVRAWKVTGHEPARRLALGVGEHLVRELLSADGTRLARVWKNGQAKLEGTLEDYAFVAAAFLDLAELTGDVTWWQRGARLLATIESDFYDVRDGVGVLYLTAQRAGAEPDLLMHRPEAFADGPMPSGAAVAVQGFLRLGFASGNAASLALAERYLAERLTGSDDAASPLMVAGLYAALDLYLHSQLLVLSPGAGADALRQAARQAYAPTLIWAGPWSPAAMLEGKGARADGQAQAFVCRGQTCSAPVSTPAQLALLLAREDGERRAARELHPDIA